MNAPATPPALLQEAHKLIQQGQAARALELLKDIARGDPHYAVTQHLRAAAQYALGNAPQALATLIDAVRAGERTGDALLNLARIAGATTLDEETARLILDLLQWQVPKEHRATYAQAVFEALGFVAGGDHARKAVVFRLVALPLLRWALEARMMDLAVFLESLVYERFVKSEETEQHFRYCMEAITPAMREAGQYWRQRLDPLPAPPPGGPFRLGFFIHNASMLAHIEVLINVLKGYRQLPHQPFEAVICCFAGHNDLMEETFASLGIRVIHLDERFPAAKGSAWRLMLSLRELVSQEGLHGIAWVSLAPMMALAFAMRIAPVQIWWALKYHGLEFPEIDGYVTGGSITKYRTIDGRPWRSGQLGVDNWYDPSQEEEAARIRATYGDRLVLGSIGRTEKLSDDTFLATIVRLLQDNRDCVFLWPGRLQDAKIQSAFDRGGVSDRTFFIGWVNTRLYAQVIDIFLDSFPFPSGFSLFQAMAAGKPAIIYESRESLETGLYAFVGPVLAGTEGTPQEQQALHEIVYGDGERPGIGIASTPDQYRALAQALIDDPAWRAQCGAVSRALVGTYLSSPTVMGASHCQHFVEILAGHFPALANVELRP